MEAAAHSHGAARKQRLDDRIGVGQVQSEVSDSRDHSVIGAKHPEKPVSDPAQREYILRAGALIAPQQEAVSRVMGSAEQVRERVDVAQSQIDSLSGERMHDVRRVADERYSPLR
jgi:hypothetical protein